MSEPEASESTRISKSVAVMVAARFRPRLVRIGANDASQWPPRRFFARGDLHYSCPSAPVRLSALGAGRVVQFLLMDGLLPARQYFRVFSHMKVVLKMWGHPTVMTHL